MQTLKTPDVLERNQIFRDLKLSLENTRLAGYTLLETNECSYKPKVAHPGSTFPY